MLKKPSVIFNAFLLLLLTALPVYSVTKTIVDTDSSQTVINKDLSSNGIIATGSTTSQTLASRYAQVFNVKDYGAQGNGVANDTVAIQAAMTACIMTKSGEIIFPQGTYNHTALSLVPSSGQIHCNLRGLGGSGAAGVLLNYIGTGGTALTIKNNTRFLVENIRFIDGGTGSIGLLITSLASGSSTGPGSFRNVFIASFAKNYVIGQTSGESASELVHINFEVSNGTSHGIEINGANSLDINFYGLNMTSNATGLEAVDPDNVYIYGGSASNNTVQDFAFRQAGAFGIMGYRSEGAERFLTVGPDVGAGSGSPSNFTLANCRIGQTNNADNRAIRLHKSVQASISNNHIQDGHISISMASTVSAYIGLVGNLVVDGSYLYEFEDSGTSSVEVEAKGNRSATASSANYWPDERFIHTLGTAKYLSYYDLSTPTAPIVKRSHTIVATGSLPAAGASMDGTVLIEDVGAGDRNLVIYGGGQRFRIDGGTNF